MMIRIFTIAATGFLIFLFCAQITGSDEEAPTNFEKLGIQLSPLSDDLKSLLGLHSGLLVGSVKRGGIAEAADIRKGDIILGCSRRFEPFQDVSIFKLFINKVLKDAPKIPLVISRYGKEILRTVSFRASTHKKNFPSILPLKLDQSIRLLDVWVGSQPVRNLQGAPLLREEMSLAITLYGARNERLSFYLIIQPRDELLLTSVEVSDLQLGDEATIDKESITAYVADYIHLGEGEKEKLIQGPLVPLSQPLKLGLQKRAALWFAVDIPKSLPATGPGWFRGNLIFNLQRREEGKVIKEKCKSMLRLKLFSFELPDLFHTRTAFQFAVNPEMHNLKLGKDVKNLHSLYVAQLARYGISALQPFIFCQPRQITIEAKTELQIEDFKDAAENFFCKLKCNSAALSEPFLTEKLQYLKRKGWLDNLFVVVKDDSEPKEVREKLETLKKSYPQLKRMLVTEKRKIPCRKFAGLVDIWVGAAELFSPKEALQAHRRGEELWWILDTGIDSADGVPDFRQRCWQMERYNIQGAFAVLADNKTNPWRQPASGARFYLLYPPVREKPLVPMLAKPLPSIQLELLKAGLQDREYFRILESEMKRLNLKQGMENSYLYLIQLVREVILSSDALTQSDQPSPDLEKMKQRFGFAIELLRRYNGIELKVDKR